MLELKSPRATTGYLISRKACNIIFLQFFPDSSPPQSSQSRFILGLIFSKLSKKHLFAQNLDKMKKILTLLIFSALLNCATTNKKVECPVYAVLPPKSFSETTSDYLASVWIKSATKRLPDCHRFAKWSRLKALYRRFSFSPLEPPKIADITPGIMESLYNQTGTTHIVILNYRPNKRLTKIVFKPEIYRGTPPKKISKNSLAKPMRISTNPKRLREGKAYSAVNTLLKFMPNSIAAGFSSYQMNNDRFSEEHKWDDETVKSNSSIPKFISSIKLTSTSHPEMYRSLDFDYDIFMSVILLNLDDTYQYKRFEKSNPEANILEEEVTYSLKLFGGGPLANVSLSTYLWKARLFFEMGLGAGYVTASDSLSNKYSKWVGLVNFGFGFDLFLFNNNKDLFIRISGLGTNIEPALIENEVFKSQRAIYTFIGLGYYMGTLSF